MITLTGPNAQATVTFDWVAVGNPGNTADQLNSANVPGIGSVAYTYRIAKYEVTNAQYAEFLNMVAASDPSGLYNTLMNTDSRGGITRSGSSGSFTYATKVNMANKPVNFVSFIDAMRFVNWLENGQSSGGTEYGVYTISNGHSEIREPNVNYFIPTENEWYKAAYHQPASQGGDVDDYWLYATNSNSVPTIATVNSVGDISNPGINVANYTILGPFAPTTVGSAGPSSASYYGTFDQNGNVWEWNETLVTVSDRGQSGGSLRSSASALQSSFRGFAPPVREDSALGFRVASSFIPIAGDLDIDGFVGIADLNLILTNWNQFVPPADARADIGGFGGTGPDGYIGIDDLNRVLGNWNAGTPPSAIAIPEPATLSLFLVFGTALLWLGPGRSTSCDH